MALIINKTPKDGYKYIVESQKGEENPFSVNIKPVPMRDFLNLEDHMVERIDGNVVIAQGVFSFRLLQHAVVGWENMTDLDGSSMVFPTIIGVASEETISCIPADVITDIANVVTAISRDSSNIKIYFPED